jgi:hypothetical protein
MISALLPPGTEIVCIDVKPCNVPIKLKLNEVYTVRGFVRHWTGEISVLLNEVDAVQPYGLYTTDEIGFYRHRFRVLEICKEFSTMIEKSNSHLKKTVDA